MRLTIFDGCSSVRYGLQSVIAESDRMLVLAPVRLGATTGIASVTDSQLTLGQLIVYHEQ